MIAQECSLLEPDFEKLVEISRTKILLHLLLCSQNFHNLIFGNFKRQLLIDGCLIIEIRFDFPKICSFTG